MYGVQTQFNDIMLKIYHWFSLPKIFMTVAIYTHVA